MKNENIPIEVVEFLNILDSAHYDSYIVGGAVRDSILGKKPKDFDIATSATVDELCDLFKEYKVIKTGLKHGTITILRNDLNIEITTYRDFDKTLRGDLSLRDFTINSIAYSLKDGLIDYTGGINDLKNKIIKLNGNDDGRFIEDPLRILRTIRFAAVLDFNIDTKTNDYIYKDSELLNNVSHERIRDEFSKIILSSNPSKYIREYFDIFMVIMPELAPLKGYEQHNPHHIYDCLEHTLRVLDNVEPDLTLRLAALFHDSGKPATYTMDEKHIGHFYNHQKISVEISRKVLHRLKYSNEIIKRVNHLIYYHDYPLTLTKKSIRKLLNYFGLVDIDKLLAIKRADILGQSPDYRSRLDTVDAAKQMMDEIICDDECFSLDGLKVSGKDLILIGITGSDIGYVLKQLLDLVVREEVPNNYDKLLLQAKEIIKSRGAV